MSTMLQTPLRASVRRTMIAARITAPGVCQLAEVPVPEPKEGQLLIRLEGCGVCASNIPPWEGRPWFAYPLAPGALGHEGWGVVETVGPGVSAFSPGQRVAVLSQNAYAQYDVARVDAAVALPPGSMPFPAEPLGCAMNIFARAQIRKGQTVAIVGVGFLGALLTRLAANAGACVIAISRRPFSLEIARNFGAAHVLPMLDREQILEQVRQLTHGRFCAVVVEAVGKQGPLDLAAELACERGRLIVAGYHQDGPRQVNMQLWNWRGLDVINAHERDPAIYLAGMRAAVRAVETGDLNPSPLYSHAFPLDQLGEALNMTRDRPDRFMKALIRL